MKHLKTLGALAALLLLVSCTGLPGGVDAVAGFDVARYEGKWSEIARLDHGFERGLTNVSATYSRRADGSVQVLNRGFDPAAGKYKEARGTAKFTGDPTVASLEVSFFWPIYGGYNVIALDPAYRVSMVCGPSRDYLWILARDRSLPNSVLKPLLDQAEKLGFDTKALIFVAQDRPDA